MVRTRPEFGCYRFGLAEDLSFILFCRSYYLDHSVDEYDGFHK
jgi:hypothetical protein